MIDADDLADECVFLLRHYEGGDMINAGSGQEISIRDLALLMKSVVEFDGDVQFDTSRPDGTPRRLMDNSKLSALGWRSSLTIEAGINKMYRWFVEP
ncbi:MAG: GDP-L-fucose synthase, partial [Mycobacterium sp.]